MCWKRKKINLLLSYLLSQPQRFQWKTLWLYTRKEYLDTADTLFKLDVHGQLWFSHNVNGKCCSLHKETASLISKNCLVVTNLFTCVTVSICGRNFHIYQSRATRCRIQTMLRRKAGIFIYIKTASRESFEVQLPLVYQILKANTIWKKELHSVLW